MIASRNLLALGEKNMCRARKPPLFMLYARKEQNENSLTQVRGSHSAQVIHRYIANREAISCFCEPLQHCVFFSFAFYPRAFKHEQAYLSILLSLLFFNQRLLVIIDADSLSHEWDGDVV